MIDKKYKNIEDKLELLKHTILIRDIIEENKETKQITYKYKEYDENGNITKQGKTNCKINSIEEAVNLCTDKFHPLAKISKDVAAGAVVTKDIPPYSIAAVDFSGRWRNDRLRSADC